jgi:hypothetical protein
MIAQAKVQRCCALNWHQGGSYDGKQQHELKQSKTRSLFTDSLLSLDLNQSGKTGYALLLYPTSYCLVGILK